MATEMAVGLAMAQQMIQQGQLTGAAAAQPAAAGAAVASSALPDLLAPADVAKLLGVPESDVMAIIESGDLPAKKIGSSHRVKRSAVEEYLSK
jgi:excisionase family DNA binding protein